MAGSTGPDPLRTDRRRKDQRTSSLSSSRVVFSILMSSRCRKILKACRISPETAAARKVSAHPEGGVSRTSGRMARYGNLGSAFDEDDIKNRLIAMLSIHAGVGLMAIATQVALAVSVEPISMLMVGPASDVQRRNSGQFLFTKAENSSLRIDAENAVDAATLIANADQVADELTAKLALRLQSLRR